MDGSRTGRLGRVGRYFALFTLAFSGAVFAALLALNLGNHAWYARDTGSVLYHFALPAALALGCFALLRAPRGVRLVAALNLAAAAAALYLAEGWLHWSHRQGVRAAAERAGHAPDTRAKAQVVADLRRAGHVAYPATRGAALLAAAPGGDTLISTLSADGAPLLPLASVPEATIVSCNETGRWLTFTSDEHGFRNPPGTWRQHRTRLALVGDSFVQGDCVEAHENLAAHLGALGPLVNVGVAGFGPLQSLAVIEEYLPVLAPQVVLWFFYEGNDLVKDLPVEKRAPMLRAYAADRRYSQRLAVRGPQIGAVLARHIDDTMVETLERTDHPWQAFMDFAQLFRLREALGLDPIGLGVFEGLEEADFALFETVLAQAARTVRGWNGRLVFVYLPDSARFFAAQRDSVIREQVRERTLAIARGLGLPVIDVVPGFAAHPRPRSLFHFPGSHYNPAGYARAAAQVHAGLSRLGLADPRPAR